jgi:hypothetical protein
MPEDQGKDKVDKLDEGFLFAISLTNILFVMIQSFLSGVSFLLYSLPLLVMGVLLPFYFGYWKGALENSAIMRVKGWVYLYFGTVGYIVYLICFNAEKILPAPAPKAGMIFIAFFSYFSGKFIYDRILNYIFKICNKEVSPLDMKLLASSVYGALSLLPSFLFLSGSLNSRACQGTINPTVCLLITYLIIPLFLFLLWLYIELNSQKLLRKYGKPYRIIVPRKEFLERHEKLFIALALLSTLLAQTFLLLLTVMSFISLPEEFSRAALLIAVIIAAISCFLEAIVAFVGEEKIIFEE